MNKHKAKLQIRLVQGDIGNVGTAAKHDHPRELPPIDAIAVGHYAGIPPVRAELAVDKGISEPLFGRNNGRLVITELSKRTIINGSLGRPFFLADARFPGRVIADCGMGLPSQFGESELRSLVRDLVWSLDLMGKRHLATVLIGSGNGNLPAQRAVACWLAGAHDALQEAARSARPMFSITFVELSAKKFLTIHQALEFHSDLLKSARATYLPPPPRLIDKAQSSSQRLRKRRHEPFARQVIVDKIGRDLRFGEISGDSVVSEYRKPYERDRVDEQQEQVVGAGDQKTQIQLGTTFLRLLVPLTFHRALMPSPPLVLICDTAAAQVAWEMLPVGQDWDPGDQWKNLECSFLGLARGLTRQIKLRGDRRPGPVYEPRNEIRALVVADPAEDARLPGALAEGKLIDALFEEFNDKQEAKGNRRPITVKSLLGPKAAATPSVVTGLLQQDSYDIIHFAGHGRYDASNLPDSGWVFSRGRLFAARDLELISRVPSLVFSNACDSGKLPARSRSLRRMAPTFAEAFMLGGASNFVCTAWEVDDRAALRFAEAFYKNLLGVGLDPQPMHLAMQAGRAAAIETRGGLSSWGAYQHYGDPLFRLFR